MKQICELYINAMNKGTGETRVIVVENLLSIFEILPPLNYGTDVSEAIIIVKKSFECMYGLYYECASFFLSLSLSPSCRACSTLRG